MVPVARRNPKVMAAGCHKVVVRCRKEWACRPMAECRAGWECLRVNTEMIQIRKTNGEVVPVPTGCFVELVNDHDQSVNLAFYQEAPGTVIQVSPETKAAKRYADMFKSLGVKFNDMMILRNKE